MNFAAAILAALALLSLVLTLWQWLAARRFPLNQRATGSGLAPAISLLKPLKGCDATTADSLRSWLNQDYPGPIQILFGVADAGDPVGKIVQQLIAENPKSGAQLVLCENLVGANAKVAQLVRLEQLAEHGLILISDADVRAPADLVANIVAPLAPSLSPSHGEKVDEDLVRGRIGMVNCLYRLANPSTTAMQWEAVAINADFWSQVLQSRTLKPLDYALGAAMLVRREALAGIGGFQPLADCLADDYELGQRIARIGHHVALCPVVVECWDPPTGWRGVWKHQLRWARTIRACRPLPYFFSLLSNATLWPLLWLMVEIFQWLQMATVSAPSDPTRTLEIKIVLLKGAAAAVVFLLVRIAVAQNLQHRLTLNSRPPTLNRISPFWLVPVKDLLHAALWVCAFLGNTVEWRGRKMKLRRDGTLMAKDGAG